MSTVTLAESAKLSQNQLVLGLAIAITTVNQFFSVLPFESIEGNALAYNREKTLGAVGVAGVGTAVSDALDIAGNKTAKNPAAFTLVTSTLTTILGDAEVNGMIDATRSNLQDQRAIQVASKAKSAGRQYQKMLITGTGANDQFTGLSSLCASSQKVATGNDGSELTFDILDSLIDLVQDKDGTVDYIMMSLRERRKFMSLLRALGGASINDTIELPDGKTVHAYRNIPVFANDWIPTDETKGGTVGTCAKVYAGTLADGSRSNGIAGLTAARASGLQVKNVGEKEDADETITRVVWYCGLAMFSELGLALADGIHP